MSTASNPTPRRGLSRREFLKRASVLGAGIPLAGALAACTVPAAPAGQTGEGSAPGAEPYTVEFWDMVWGPPEYVDTGNALVAQFNEEHTDIQATYQSTPWNNWYQTFLTAIGSGTAPDVSTGAGYQAVDFYGQGAVIPVDHIVEDWEGSGEIEDFLPGTVERLRYDGHYMAIPWAIDIRIPWVRTDFLDEAGLELPETWEELESVVAALTEGDRYGIVGANDTGGSHYLLMLMFNNAGGLFNEAFELDVMYERNIEALEYFSNLVTNGWMHPGSAGFTGDDADRAFGQGFAAIKVDNPDYPAAFPDLADVMAPTPVLLSPHDTQGTISWVNNIMMYAQSENPDAATTFLKWWSQNELPLWTEGNTTQLPVRASFAADPHFQGRDHLAFIIDQWVPVGKGTAERAEGIAPVLNQVEGEGVLQTLTQDLLQGRDVMEAVQAAEERLQAIVG